MTRLPGPWTIGSKSKYGTHNPSSILGGDGGICQVYGIPLHCTLEDVQDDPRHAEGLANARLIAAAPDLYQLLLESTANIGGDWRTRRDELLAKIEGAS